MKERGFTLLEMLIVIVIIGTLATIAIPRYFDAIQRARKTEALATLREIRSVEQAYYTVNGAYFPVDTDLTGDTLAVDLDADGTDDISLAIPTSPNYTYSITLTKAIATKKVPGSKKSYDMELDSGTWTEF